MENDGVSLVDPRKTCVSLTCRGASCVDDIYSIAGSGKSTLLYVVSSIQRMCIRSLIYSTSSAIIENIRDMRTAGLASMAYYYFDFHDVKKQDRYGLLSSLLFQLSAQLDVYHGVLSRLFAENADGIEKPTHSALLKCLNDMLRLRVPGHFPTYIIVDALDECPNFSERPTAREEVLELIEELVHLELPVHLCVASRPEIDIRTALEPLTDLQISLHDERGQREDVIAYINAVVHSDKRMQRWRKQDQNLVVDELCKHADGS